MSFKVALFGFQSYSYSRRIRRVRVPLELSTSTSTSTKTKTYHEFPLREVQRVQLQNLRFGLPKTPTHPARLIRAATTIILVMEHETSCRSIRPWLLKPRAYRSTRRLKAFGYCLNSSFCNQKLVPRPENRARHFLPTACKSGGSGSGHDERKT